MKFCFKHQVRRQVHSQRLVGKLGFKIFALNVQAQSTHVRVVTRQLFDVPVKGFENALPAPFGRDVDALNPPEMRVPPVAPFPGDEKLTDNFSGNFSDVVRTVCRLRKNRLHALGQQVVVQILFSVS